MLDNFNENYITVFAGNSSYPILCFYLLILFTNHLITEKIT